MHAVIPAAGQGTRLYPQTHTKPKPMVRVAGKPILGHILDNFRNSRIDDVVIVVGVMKEKVTSYITAEYSDVFDVTFVEQAETKGLGHSIYQARPVMDGDPLCIALGDMLFDNGYHHFLAAHDDLAGVDGSIGVKQVPEPSKYGIVTHHHGTVVDLEEKPSQPESDLAISGVYIIEDSTQLFDAIEYHLDRELRGAGNEYQLTDALQRMIEQGADLGTFEVEDWYDCGRPETLLEANRVLLDRHHRRQQSGTDLSIVIPPADIGENVAIEKSVVGPYVSIDDDVKITDSRVKDSIVGRGTHLYQVNLCESLVGENTTIRGNSNELNIGDSSEVDL